MRRILSRLANFLRREDGPTTVEYAVLLALIVSVCLTAVQTLGRGSRTQYRDVSRVLQNSSGS